LNRNVITFADVVYVICETQPFSLNGLKIGEGKRGKIFNKILHSWSTNVNLDIEAQIKNWNKKDKKSISGVTPYKF
jgi:hypothetical protein